MGRTRTAAALQTLFMAALLLPALADPAHAWGRGHGVIRPWAVARLPAWQQELLKPVRARLERDYLALQDAYANGGRPDLQPYCTVPGVAFSLHDVPDPAVAAKGIAWYLEQVDRCIDAGELDEAARYLGVLCHWLEDPGSPSAHCLSPLGLGEAQLRELLPPTGEWSKFAYTYGHHGIGDIGAYTIAGTDYTPRILGASIPEAALHLMHAQRRSARLARGMIIPVLQSVLAGDAAQADRHRGTQARAVAEVTADCLYTALCLAAGKGPDAEGRALDGFDLTRLEHLPVAGKASEPYVWIPFLVGRCLDGKRQLKPIILSGREEASEAGIGMGAGGWADFPLAPAGVYRRLTVTAGIHRDAGPEGAVRFVVRLGAKELLRSDPVKSGQPGVPLTVALPEDTAGVLRLGVEPEPDTKPFDNLAVWAEPRLWCE